jgi:hypothetical protein
MATHWYSFLKEGKELSGCLVLIPPKKKKKPKT